MKQRVVLKVLQIKTDPSNYKIFDVALGSVEDKPLYVGLEVDKEQIITNEEQKIVVTLDGMKELVGQIADGFDELDKTFKETQIKRRQR